MMYLINIICLFFQTSLLHLPLSIGVQQCDLKRVLARALDRDQHVLQARQEACLPSGRDRGRLPSRHVDEKPRREQIEKRNEKEKQV